jgi:hypothetical protein
MALYPSQCTIVIYEDFHVTELPLTLPDVEQLPATCAAFSSDSERQLLYRGGPFPKTSMSCFSRLDTTFTSTPSQNIFYLLISYYQDIRQMKAKGAQEQTQHIEETAVNVVMNI